jgi:TonB family protein
MPHALLLSPDDQAVSAITGVLEEMSVTCERPLDGVSAAQKLNSQSFDLVLVDCENLPAAKLIFDVCRRGKNGNNPVPIAIVDGRAGLPTAFRLGAELILTKPVAKDQARGTIRTAVSRVRKNVPANESAPAQPASAAVAGVTMPGATPTGATTTGATTTGVTTTDSVPTEERALAAAAGAGSSRLTGFAEPAPAVTTKMNSVVDEIDASPAAVNSKPARPLIPSDDPVLAELERTELEESERAEAKLAESQKLESQKPESQKAESQKQSSEPAKAAPDEPAANSDAPLPSLHRQGRQKTRGSLVALLMLGLAGAGFYATWTYQPGFRAIVQPQIDRVLALAGIALPPTSAPNPVKPSPQQAPVTIPAAASPAGPNKTQTAAPDSAAGSAGGSITGSTTTSATANAAVQSSAATRTAGAPPPSIGLADTKNDTKNDSKRDAATSSNASSSAPLPGEKSAVILSSKGAESRLAQSVAPKYPAEARSEGTVILKAVVDENGKVEGLRLVEGNAALATAAIQAVKQWRYRPYVRDGKAQSFQTVVIVDFQRP